MNTQHTQQESGLATAKFLGVLVAVLVAWGSAATAALAEGRWQALENNPSCVVWNAYPQPSETMTGNGACANGKERGRGAKVWRHLADGEWKESKYTGAMKGGKGHGRGVLVLANGNRSDRYEGDWKDGKRHGRGVKVWADGSRYEGEFRDGNRTGRGVLVWGPKSERAGDRYEGDWKDGKRTGRGVIVFANGNRYEGDFKDNEYNGRGVFVFANGDKCEGDWREHRLLGTGDGWVNGEIKKCYWAGTGVAFAD